MALSKFVTTPKPTSFLVSRMLRNCLEKDFVGGLHPLSVAIISAVKLLISCRLCFVSALGLLKISVHTYMLSILKDPGVVFLAQM